MSNPRNWWYTDVKRAVMHYPKYKDRTEPEYKRYQEAIAKALHDVQQMPNADERMRAIDDVLFNQTKTIEGVALELHYSWRVVQNWITEFINLVGAYKGYERRK